MTFTPQTIYQIYTGLRESLGNNVLNISKTLMLTTINLHEKNYYVLHNLTKKTFEITLENEEVFNLTGRVFVSTFKPIKANELFINTLDTKELVTLDDLTSKQKIIKEPFCIKETDTTVINMHVKDSKHLNDDLELFKDYAFKVKLNPDFVSLVNFIDEGLCLRLQIETGQSWVFKNTVYLDNVLYTNSITRVLQGLLKAEEKLPNTEKILIERQVEDIRNRLNNLIRKLPRTSLIDILQVNNVVCKLEKLLQ